MSMIGNFRASTDEEVEALLADPERIEGVLYPDDDVLRAAAVEFDVDKAWHAIHFLLCGDAEKGQAPLNFVVAGGTEVGDVDVGYGPARVFTSKELAEIVRALEPISSADLKKRYDAHSLTMQEVYPQIWDEPKADCLDNYVLYYFDRLKVFLRQVAAAGKALIVYLN